MAIMVIFKGDGSLDTLFSRYLETCWVFWTCHISGYPMEPIGYNKDFQEAVRKIQNGLKRPIGWFSKETADF